MKKLSPKKVNKLYAAVLIAGAVTAFAGAFTETTALVIIGVIVLMANVVFRLAFFRCPHCGVYLDRSTGDFCPHCGREVNEID